MNFVKNEQKLGINGNVPGIFKVIVRKVALAQFSKINGDRHFFTAIVQVNLFFVHLHDVGSVERLQAPVFFAPVGGRDG